MRRSEEGLDALLRRWAGVSIDDACAGLDLAERAEEYVGQLSTVLLARALNIKGSSYRALGRFQEAIDLFYHVLEILLDDEYLDRADTYRRMSMVFLEQLNFDDALSHVDRAIELYQTSTQDRHQLGEGYLAKGIIYNEMHNPKQSVELLGRSVELLDPAISPEACANALHNLLVGFSLCKTLNLDVIQNLLGKIEQARAHFRKDFPIHRLKLRWIESNIMGRLGMNKKSLVDLRHVRRELRHNRRPAIEMGMITIDIAQAWLSVGDSDYCALELEKAYAFLEAVEGINPDALIAISQAVELLGSDEFDVDVFYDIRKTIVRPTEKLDHPS